MTDLAETAAPPTITFLNSLPLDLLLTLALVPAAEQFDGLDVWLREARAALPAGLYREIALLTGFPGGHLRFVEAVAARAVGPEQLPATFAGWIAHLESLPAAAFQSMALHALRHGISAETVADQDLLDPLYLRAYLAARDPERNHTAAIPLVLEPAGLRARFLAALTRFWELAYRARYEAGRPLRERSVAHHRGQSYAGPLAEIFRTVTGRDLPAEVQFHLPGFHQVRFVPSCHLGTRVAFFRAPDVLTVFCGVADV